jgi:hypothetical protein
MANLANISKKRILQAMFQRVSHTVQSNLSLFLLGGLLLIGGVGIGVYFGQTEDVSEANFHGPHFVQDQVATVSKADFSWAKRQRIGQTTVVRSPGNAPIIITDAPVTLPVALSAGTASSTTLRLAAARNDYGIAAGGDLIWYPQDRLDEYFASLKALGVGWVRWDMDWSAIQPDNAATYAWQGPDRVAATAAKYGISSLAIITIAPQWALDPSAGCSVDQHCPPLDPAAFAHFASEAATRYKGSISTWEIWNEPNLNALWRVAAHGAGYPAYLKAAYTAIKQVEPSAVVLSGGLAAAADTGTNTSPITFIRSLYTGGAQNYFDAVALHPYSYPVAASYIASWNSWQQMAGIHQVMVENGDSAKKIWVTEYGAPTGGPGSSKTLNQLSFVYGADYMTESVQQQLLGDVISLYKQNRDWVGPFFWYSFRDIGTSNSTPENFFGLLRYDGSQKPAYQLFAQVVAGSI